MQQAAFAGPRQCPCSGFDPGDNNPLGNVLSLPRLFLVSVSRQSAFAKMLEEEAEAEAGGGKKEGAAGREAGEAGTAAPGAPHGDSRAGQRREHAGADLGRTAQDQTPGAEPLRENGGVGQRDGVSGGPQGIAAGVPARAVLDGGMPGAEGGKGAAGGVGGVEAMEGVEGLEGEEEGQEHHCVLCHGKVGRSRAP